MANRRVLGFLVFATLIVGGCVRLGFWQMGRLADRRAANRVLAARLGAPVATMEGFAGDTTDLHYRRLRIEGRYDYAHEFVLTARSRHGSPGVHLVTPFLPAAGGDAVLVNRGWVYSADGMVIDASAWREPAGLAARVEGHVEVMAPAQGTVSSASVPRGVRRLAPDSLAARLPYRIAPFVVVQALAERPADGSVRHPVRLDAPSLPDGPHRGYALQWFAFAVIGVIGMAAVVLAGRRTDPGQEAALSRRGARAARS